MCQIGCKSTEITLPVKGFGGHNLNGFTPNLTGRIGGKSIEIMTTKFDQEAYKVISMNFYPNRPASISMDLHPIRPVEFDWALITDQTG